MRKKEKKMEGKNRNKTFVNREGFEGWGGAWKKSRSQIYHVQVQLPMMNVIMYIYDVSIKFKKKEF